jgi:hypothetical protein
LLASGSYAPAVRRLLEAAVARYAGDSLEEDLYEDWALPLREEARAVFLAVRTALEQTLLLGRL